MNIILKTQRIIAEIDKQINDQINAIIHHKKLQQLEASWRGLYYLTQQIKPRHRKQVKIKILSITADELNKDLLQSVDFEQSLLFEKIYTQEYDHPGGEPYGLLIADFLVSHKSFKWLEEISKISASAFTPCVLATDPEMFGIDNFSELNPLINFNNIFKQDEYLHWKQLRLKNPISFIGLVLPKILMRNIYQYSKFYNNNLFFTEVYESHDDLLWGNATYCYAASVIQSYLTTGWFFQTTDVQLNMVKTSIHVTDRQERILSDHGFISLCSNKFIPQATFYNSQSLRKSNNKLAVQLPYLLCACRFAHYIKVIMRDKIGGFKSAKECEEFLQQWILHYCASHTDVESNLYFKYPLVSAKISIKPISGTFGKYNCVIYIKPRHFIEGLKVELSLTNKLELKM